MMMVFGLGAVLGPALTVQKGAIIEPIRRLF